MPIPTIAAAFAVADNFVVGGGIAAPYAGLHRYDDDGPQRYSSVSLAGSTFVIGRSCPVATSRTSIVRAAGWRARMTTVRSPASRCGPSTANGSRSSVERVLEVNHFAIVAVLMKSSFGNSFVR